MDGVSLPGLIGAALGLVIGMVDYRIVSALLRKRWDEKERAMRDGKGVSPGPGTQSAILKLVFVLTIVGFPIVGYLFGASVG